VHEVRKWLTDEVIARLVADYESGCSTTGLMRDYQLGKGTVLGLLAEHGVKMRGKAFRATGFRKRSTTTTAGSRSSGWLLGSTAAPRPCGRRSWRLVSRCILGGSETYIDSHKSSK
jgi:hypothetical protein